MKKLPVTVLVVDDFAPFRGVVSSLLREGPTFQIVAEASDGLEAVEKSRQLQPDLILLDIGLPKLDGLKAAEQIREVAPQSEIIFVTQDNSVDTAKKAIASGARGYVVKAKVASELLKAIGLVLQGKQFMSTGLSGDL